MTLNTQMFYRSFVSCLVLCLFIELRGSEVDYASMSLEELMRVEIVRVATGFAQPIHRAPSVTSVITAEDIRNTGALEIEDVLETVPGMHVMRSPINYYNPIYSLSGIQSIYNPEMLVLVNGVPQNTLYTGGCVIVGYGGNIPVEFVERIEVIRGPGSALYGADAYSGVINIITKNADNLNGTRVGSRVGSFDTREAWAMHGKQYGNWKTSLAFKYSETDGHEGAIAEDAQTQYDRLTGTTASKAPGKIDLQRQRFDVDSSIAYNELCFHTNYQGRRRVGAGSGVAQALADNSGYSLSDRVYSDLSYVQPEAGTNLALETKAFYSFTRYALDSDYFTIYPPGAFLDRLYPVGMRGNTSVDENHYGTSVALNYSGITDHRVRAETGYRFAELAKVTDKRNFGMNPFTGSAILPTAELVDISGTPMAFIPTGNRQNVYGLLQDVWSLNREFEMTTGIRYDHFSDFGDSINPRWALTWMATDDLTAKLIYGRAFRAPSFQELYQANNPVALGNKNLKPETLDMWEAETNYRVSKEWSVTANTFYYRSKDKINFVADANSQNRYAKNSGSQEGYGFVFSNIVRAMKRLTLSGNYSFLQTKVSGGEMVADAPHHDIYGRADLKIANDWSVTTQANWILDRNRIAGDPRSSIADNVTVDSTLHYQPEQSKWSAFLSVRNVLDENARESSPGPDGNGLIMIPGDIPMSGRALYVGVEYGF